VVGKRKSNRPKKKEEESQNTTDGPQIYIKLGHRTDATKRGGEKYRKKEPPTRGAVKRAKEPSYSNQGRGKDAIHIAVVGKRTSSRNNSTIQK